VLTPTPMTMPRMNNPWRSVVQTRHQTSSKTRHNTIHTDSTINGEQCVLYTYVHHV
jgi:hypothetical protein